MASRKSSRSSAKKPTRYAEDDNDDDEDFDDDDFTPSVSHRQTKKAKTGVNPENKSLKPETVGSKPRPDTERQPLDEKIFERDLQRALERSKQTSTTTSSVCVEALTSASLSAEPMAPVQDDVDSVSDVTDTHLSLTSNPSTLAVVAVGGRTQDTGEEYKENSEESSERSESSSECTDDEEYSAIKAKSTKTTIKSTAGSKIEGKVVTAKPAAAGQCKKLKVTGAVERVEPVTCGSGKNKSSIRAPGVSSVSNSTLISSNRSFTSPSSGLRLGLSRRGIVKSLHGPTRAVNS